MPPLYGLIGYPLTHSFSPAYFKDKFAALRINAQYQLFPLGNIADFPSLITAQPHLAGLNVTIPYKTAVIPFLDEIDKIAHEIKAVNCISFRNGRIKGWNTDIIGFKQSLTPLLQPQHTQALILGTGGSSAAVAWVLDHLGISCQKVSRTKAPHAITYQELTPTLTEQHKLIINCTPLGMYPNTAGAPPLHYGSIGSGHLLYDLIYNPEETKFLSLGKAQGATIKNGYEMLQLQADAAWAIWQQNN